MLKKLGRFVGPVGITLSIVLHTPEIHKELLNISSSCDIFQRLSKEPGRFRVELPDEDIVFNRTVIMDLMSFESSNGLHIIDKDTLFSAAIFLSSGESAENIWNDYMKAWVLTYIGYYKRTNTDQGPQFTSGRWVTLLRDANIEKG